MTPVQILTVAVTLNAASTVLLAWIVIQQGRRHMNYLRSLANALNRHEIEYHQKHSINPYLKVPTVSKEAPAEPPEANRPTTNDPPGDKQLRLGPKIDIDEGPTVRMDQRLSDFYKKETE